MTLAVRRPLWAFISSTRGSGGGNDQWMAAAGNSCNSCSSGRHRWLGWRWGLLPPPTAGASYCSGRQAQRRGVHRCASLAPFISASMKSVLASIVLISHYLHLVCLPFKVLPRRCHCPTSPDTTQRAALHPPASPAASHVPFWPWRAYQLGWYPAALFAPAGQQQWQSASADEVAGRQQPVRASGQGHSDLLSVSVDVYALRYTTFLQLA